VVRTVATRGTGTEALRALLDDSRHLAPARPGVSRPRPTTMPATTTP
jgi:hypothetical protein